MSSFADNNNDAAASSGGENIWISASDGDLKRVKELIESGTSVNVQDEFGYAPL